VAYAYTDFLQFSGSAQNFIRGLCDVFDALTSNRPYKAGWDPAQSLKQMASWVNGHFDPKIFQAFVSSLGIYPTGSLVLLDNNKLAVVTDQTPGSLLKPMVKVFFSTKSNMRIMPELVDLSKTQGSEKIASREDPAIPTASLQGCRSKIRGIETGAGLNQTPPDAIRHPPAQRQSMSRDPVDIADTPGRRLTAARE